MRANSRRGGAEWGIIGGRTMVESATRKSVLDEILDDWFAELENVQGFEAETIERLRRLASRGRLARPAEVRKAIDIEEGGAT